MNRPRNEASSDAKGKTNRQRIGKPRSARHENAWHNIGALISRIGFGVYSTIVMIRIIKAPTLRPPRGQQECATLGPSPSVVRHGHPKPLNLYPTPKLEHQARQL